MSLIKIPDFFKEYFWDVNFPSLDANANKTFVIKRVLDRGNTSALKWLLQNYTLVDIKNTIIKSRDISAKTANFWASLLKIDRDKIACLQKPYSPTQFGLSS